MVVRLGRYEENLLRIYEARENRRRQERKVQRIEVAAWFMNDFFLHISDRNLIHPVLIGYLGSKFYYRNASW